MTQKQEIKELIINKTKTSTAECLAQEHAAWYASHFAKVVELVYRDAFVHGFKHGREDTG